MSLPCCFLQVALCLCWGMGEGNNAGQLLCSWRGVSMSAAFRDMSKKRKYLPTVCPKHYSDYCCQAVFPQVVCQASFQEQGSRLRGLSQPSLLTFTTPGFKPCLLLKIMKYRPSHFPSQWLWGNIPLCAVSLSSPTMAPSPPQHLESVSLLNLLWYGLFSRFSHGVFFCPSSGQFLGFVGDLIVNLVVFIGQVEPRDLPLCHHLPGPQCQTFGVF